MIQSEGVSYFPAKRRTRTLLTWVVIGLTAFSGPVNTAFAQAKPPIKIGVLLSINTAAGAPPYAGLRIATKEINESGGIGGRQIELVVADDQSNPTQAVNEVNRLVGQQKVDVIFGPFLSQLALAIAPALNAAQVTNIAAVGTTQLTPQVANYMFSLVPPVDAAATSMVNFAESTWKVKSIAIISDDGAQSKIGVEATKKEATARKIRWEAQEYSFGTNDMTPQLLALRAKNPDALLFFSPSGEDMGRMIKSASELGWKIRMLGNNVVSTSVGGAVKITGTEAFKDVYGIASRTAGYCPSDAVGSGALARMAEKIRAVEPANAKNLEPLVSLVANGYEGAYIFKAAIEGTGGKTDGKSITAWLEQNGPSVRNNLMYGPIAASKTVHHLRGPNSNVIIVDPTNVRSDGLMRRADC